MAKYYVEVEWNGVADEDGGVLVYYAPADLLIPAELVTVATPEPKGLGAVVKDAEGDLWVRIEDDLWRNPDYLPTIWDELVGPLAVLSEGYTDGDH